MAIVVHGQARPLRSLTESPRLGPACRLRATYRSCDALRVLLLQDQMGNEASMWQPMRHNIGGPAV